MYLSPIIQALLFINFVVPLLKHPVHTLIHPVLVPLVVSDFILLCPLAGGGLKTVKLVFILSWQCHRFTKKSLRSLIKTFIAFSSIVCDGPVMDT